MKKGTNVIRIVDVDEELSRSQIAKMFGVLPHSVSITTEDPEPDPVLFPKLYDKINDLFGTIQEEVDCSPEFGDEDSDGEGSTTIAGVRRDIRAISKFFTKMEAHIASLQDTVEELTFAADKLERETKKGK